jgi:hypothetical protein
VASSEESRPSKPSKQALAVFVTVLVGCTLTHPLDRYGAEYGSADGGPSSSIAFVQAQTASAPGASLEVAFDEPVRAGDAIVVCVDYGKSGETFPQASVSDALANKWRLLTDPPYDAFGYRHAIYFANGAPAGIDRITVTLDASPDPRVELYVHEYHGIGDVEAVAANSGPWNGASTEMASGFRTTTGPMELLFGFGVAGIVELGAGFATRTALHQNLTEDRVVFGPGSYQATAIAQTANPNGGWVMLMAVFHGD